MGRWTMYTKFYLEILKGKDYLEKLWIDGKIILKNHFKELRGNGVDWIQMDQVRDQWRGFVNTATNILVA
jgi:hypothetical protein